MKRKIRICMGIIMAAAVAMGSSSATYAAGPWGQQNGLQGQIPGGWGTQNGQGQLPGGQGQNYQLSESPTEIVYSQVVNAAASLSADTASAQTITMSDTDNTVTIDSAGTYIITGTCSNGNIDVKKGTTGVVLILKDLTLTSSKSAPVSIGKGAVTQIIIEGTVRLTDAENPADEESADADVADAFDGAAIKVKDGASAYITGSGTLTIDASSCKNGIKMKDDPATSFVIDGPTINITAANDAINAGYDMTILSGSITINAGDDAIHSDRILTIGKDGSGPTIKITSCKEGLEGTVVNILGGNITLTASDDGVNAANSDGTYSNELDFSINMSAGTLSVNAGGDGLDSNGNINLLGGTITIKSASAGGEAGIDYDGSLYISDSFNLTNSGGIAGPDGGGQFPGGQPGDQNGQSQFPGGQQGQPGDQNGQPQFPGGQNGQQPQQPEGNQNGQGQTPDGQQGDGNGQPTQQPDAGQAQQEQTSPSEKGETFQDLPSTAEGTRISTSEGTASSDGSEAVFVINNAAAATVTCTRITDTGSSVITVPSTVVYAGNTYTVSRLASGALSEASSARIVSIPSAVTTIEAGAMAGAENVKKIKLTVEKQGLFTANSGAFSGLNDGVRVVITAKNKKQYNKLVKKITKAGGDNLTFRFKK